MRQFVFKVWVIVILISMLFPNGMPSRVLADRTEGFPADNQVVNGGFEDLDEYGRPVNW